MKGLFAFAVSLAMVGPAVATDLPLKKYLPNPDLTPGEANPVLTQEKVCGAGFRTGPFRKVPSSLKHEVYHAYHRQNHKGDCAGRAGCEVDHLVSLEIGGANTAANLWPQPYAGKWNAHVKDRLENLLHKKVCRGEITLEQAQEQIAADWIATWRMHFGKDEP